MTIIAGIETPQGVILGSDSGCTLEGRLISRTDRKVFTRGTSLVIGTAGSARQQQIISEYMHFPTEKKPENWVYKRKTTRGMTPERWMLLCFIPKLKEIFEAHGWTQTDRDRLDYTQTYLLVGVSNHLFAVWSDLQIERTLSGYHAIGSGSELARGSLRSTRDWLDPQRRIKESLEAAIEFNTACKGPLCIEESKVVR